MLLNTKLFQETANTILIATSLDKNAANLELKTNNNFLYLTVTNKEFFVSTKFALSESENFKAVVDAQLFLNLISGISAESFELLIKDTAVVVKVGKSNYKLPMIYENDALMQLPTITLQNKTVEMSISNDILKSILNINSKELLKIKNLDTINELQRLYYIDETGCFTFTTGACLNSFTLEKPVKLLLNDRIVGLFKLFKSDVKFSYGYDALANGIVQTKAIFETDNVYVAALLTCDDILINKVQGPCMSTKTYINSEYANKLVISVNSLSAAISRLLMFTKNSVDKINSNYITGNITITSEGLIIEDNLENTEVVAYENNSIIDDGYTMTLNLVDLKLAIDSYKNEYITLNCGNHRSVIINCGQVHNLLPECRSTGAAA